MKKIILIYTVSFCISALIGQQKPNIIWISVEDMSPRLASYGDHTVPTPNIDRLAKEGIVYEHVYTTAGVCSPSRCAIITGNYQTRVGGHNMRTTMNTFPEKTGLPLEYNVVPPAQIRCFPEYLRAKGYYVTNNDKTDYQFEAPPTVWDESSKTAHWRGRKENQPFFSIFNIMTTHESQIWYRANKPLKVNPQNVPLPPYYPDTETVRNDIARHYTNIADMDDQVGDIIQQLEDDGLLDKTIIIFWSDHGDGLPFYKREIYKRGLHVPLIVRYPDLKGAGTRNNDLISAIDFGPTVMSLAGIKTPKQMDGQPFMGKYKAKSNRNYVFGARDRLDSEYDRVRSIMNKDFQFIMNFYPEKPLYMDIDFRKGIPMMKEMLLLRDNGQLNSTQMMWFNSTKSAEEFYDLKNDPYQLNNLINDPRHQKDITVMRKELLKWIKDTSDLGAIPEKVLIKNMWNDQDTPPKTEMPVAISSNNNFTIKCGTKNASIGYRKLGETSWNVYKKPLKMKDTDLEIIAMRIGYEPSEILTLKTRKSTSY